MKNIDIFEFFPIPDDETLEKYLRQDKDYDERKQQLFHVILKALTQKKKNLGMSVVNTLFQPSYLRTHRWPTIG